jgi:hypothetical protein
MVQDIYMVQCLFSISDCIFLTLVNEQTKFLISTSYIVHMNDFHTYTWYPHTYMYRLSQWSAQATWSSHSWSRQIYMERSSLSNTIPTHIYEQTKFKLHDLHTHKYMYRPSSRYMIITHIYEQTKFKLHDPDTHIWTDQVPATWSPHTYMDRPSLSYMIITHIYELIKFKLHDLHTHTWTDQVQATWSPHTYMNRSSSSYMISTHKWTDQV